MGKLFVIASACCFGCSNAYWKKATAEVPFILVIFFRGIITTTLFGIVWFLVSKYNFFSAYILNTSNITSLQLFYTFSICIFSGFGLLFFVRSMQYEKVSIVVPLTSVNIFSILTATFLLHEAWLPEYTVSIGLTIVGIWFLFTSSLYTSLLASFFWGISYALFKLPIKWLGALPFSFILELSITLFALVTAFVNGSYQEITKNINIKTIHHYFILALLAAGGTFFVNLALINTPIAAINILSNTSQLVALLLAYLLYKEKLVLKQWIGVLSIISALVLISLL
jgi:uncharacterized membrane protein